jgi:hypothetical protein
MKSERKVYMTIDRNGRPQTFGNSNKFAWKSKKHDDGSEVEDYLAIWIAPKL